MQTTLGFADAKKELERKRSKTTFVAAAIGSSKITSRAIQTRTRARAWNRGTERSNGRNRGRFSAKSFDLETSDDEEGDGGADDDDVYDDDDDDDNDGDGMRDVAVVTPRRSARLSRM